MLLLDLKEEMSNFFKLNECSIDFTRGKGYRLLLSPDLDLKNFISYLIYRNPMVILLHDIIFRKISSTYTYCQERFISESKLNKDLSNLNKTAEQFGVSIDRKKMTLIGEEARVRYLIFLFYWKGNKLMWPFEYISEKEICDKIDCLSCVKQLNTIEKRKLLYHVAISRLRISQKNISKPRKEIPGTIYKEFKEDIARTDLIRTDNESEICALFDIFKVFSFLRSMRTCFLEELSYHSNEAAQTEIVLSLFQREFFYIEDKETYILLQSFLFSVHTLAKMSPNLEIDELGNSYLRYLKARTPNLLTKVRGFVTKLKIDSESATFNNDRFLTLYYCMIFYLLNKETIYEKEVTILFETELNLYIRERQRRNLKYILSQTCNATVLFEEELKRDTKIDLIISNLNSIEYKKNTVVNVSKKLVSSDIDSILKAIDRLR